VQPEIERLLILQERDRIRIDIETQLARLPVEIKSLQGRAEAEKAAIAAGQQALKELEVARKEIDQEVKLREEKIFKYKNQQMEVKKNEEYQALSHEIEKLQAEIGTFEEKEIAALLEIDERKASHASETAAHEKRIALYTGEIETLHEREKNLQGQLEEARREAAEAGQHVPEAYLRNYARTLQRGVRFPLVVPLDGPQCSGCHLKVSGEVEAAARHHEGPTHCDNCGRVVYWP